MKGTKAALRIARANYVAAKSRGDARACRRYLDDIATLTAAKKARKMSTVDNPYATRRKALKLGKSKATKKMVRKAYLLSEPPPAIAARVAETAKRDDELEQVKWFKRELASPDGVTRAGALEKLRSILSPDELADVLVASGPGNVVRASGPSGRSEKARAEDSLGWMIGRLGDRSIPTAERTEIVDRLTKAAANDEKASAALAKIVGGVR